MFCTPCFPTLLAGQEPLRDLEAGLKAKNASVWCIGGAEVAAELDAKRAIDQGRCPLIICFVLNYVVPSEMPRRLPSGGASMNPHRLRVGAISLKRFNRSLLSPKQQTLTHKPKKQIYPATARMLMKISFEHRMMRYSMHTPRTDG